MNQETAMPASYISREVAIGTAVSIAFSVAMATVLFIRSSAVPIDDVIFNAIPQTFFVTFMWIAVAWKIVLAVAIAVPVSVATLLGIRDTRDESR